MTPFRTPSNRNSRMDGSLNGAATLYFVERSADVCKMTAAPDTARKAFAEAVDWHIVMQFLAVTISDGSRSYSIAEFASAMALNEIADPI